MEQGVLIDGSKVAVKKLSKAKKEQDIQDFLNEIIVISNIKHRNLVQLKGCCIKGDQRILVYELVDNKNLAETLWGDSNDLVHFDWATRFNIILGIARGLAYLHEEVEPSIIHRDIKGPNILLDKDLSPKIADFGLALFYPSLDDGETHMSVSKVAGTM
jgi:serine/threonine protein kinase